MDDITKKPKFLHKVWRYKKRTIATCIIKNSTHLKEIWEEAQLELCTEYQYSGNEDNVWDYYLVFCCEFGVGNLDARDRLTIENDKFCCRKFFVFDVPAAECDTKKLITTLFPQIQIKSTIEILKPEKLIAEIDEKELLDPDFFIKPKSEDEINQIVSDLLEK